MEDTGKQNGSDNPDTNDVTGSPRIRKRDSFQSLTNKTEHNSETTASHLPNGHCKQAPLTLGQISQPSKGRAALLEPIPPKLRRGRRLSDNEALQTSCNSDSEVSSNSDEFITKMFNNSCMEALSFLKKAFDEKLVST